MNTVVQLRGVRRGHARGERWRSSLYVPCPPVGASTFSACPLLRGGHMSLKSSFTSRGSAQSAASVPFLPYWPCRFTVACFVPALLSACDSADDCTQGEVQCEQNTARTCQLMESHMTWRTEACGAKTCVVAKNTLEVTAAFCAFVPDPDSRCIEADVPNCNGNTLLECTAGYVTSAQTCAAGCIALDDHPDRCAGDIDFGPERCMGADGSFCVQEGQGVSIVSQSLPGHCLERPETPEPGYVIYSQRCEGGNLVSRTRCALQCAGHADCSTSCQ